MDERALDIPRRKQETHRPSRSVFLWNCRGGASSCSAMSAIRFWIRSWAAGRLSWRRSPTIVSALALRLTKDIARWRKRA